MDDFHLLAALVLLIAVTAGLVPILPSRDRSERLLALLLLGSAVVAVTLLLALAMAWPGLIDMALVLAVLACIMAIAFVRSAERTKANSGPTPNLETTPNPGNTPGHGGQSD